MLAKGAGGPECWYTFINIYAFVLDNFCFFEHANQSIHVHTSDFFIHRIYNDSKSKLEGAIWSWTILYVKRSGNLGESP